MGTYGKGSPEGALAFPAVASGGAGGGGMGWELATGHRLPPTCPEAGPQCTPVMNLCHLSCLENIQLLLIPRLHW